MEGFETRLAQLNGQSQKGVQWEVIEVESCEGEVNG